MSTNDPTTPNQPGAPGDGGPPRVSGAPDEPSSAARPPRALAAEQRGPAITEEAPPERAMVTRTQRRRSRQREISRRRLLGASFWGFFMFGLTGSVSAFLAFFWPRGVTGFGGKIAVAAALVPDPGDPPSRVTVGKFWITNLRPGEGAYGGAGDLGDGGLMALWWKCPHLGCTVPWKPAFTFEGVTGWFRCPCHGSTYTKAGIRVFGPAPRALDTMAITVNPDGSLTVDTGTITRGSGDNPQRATAYDA